MSLCFFFFFSSRRRHTRCGRDWSSDVCSSDLGGDGLAPEPRGVDAGAVALLQGAGRGVPPPLIVRIRQLGRRPLRSEERRVGKEWRSRGARYHERKKKERVGW